MTYIDRNKKEIKDGDLLRFRSGYIGRLFLKNGEWYLGLENENSPCIKAIYATIGNWFSSATIIDKER